MTKEKAMRLFPVFFPSNIINTIREIGYEEEINVYRICRWGKIDKQAFLSTCEEYNKGLIHLRDGINETDVGNYSTSVFEKAKDARKYYNYISRPDQYPKSIVVEMTTQIKDGLLQRTRERKKLKSYKSHIDWWLYKDSTPYDNLHNIKEVSLDELS